MPNHLLTVGLCARDFDALNKANKDYDEINLKELDGKDLCDLVLKIPEELVGIISSSPPCRSRNKITGEFSKNSNGKYGDEWERVPLTDEEITSLREKHGAVTWYEWNTINLGTKWGTYDTKVHFLGGDHSPVLIEFVTAWSPLNRDILEKIEKYLCETYYLKNVKWMYHDPYDCEIGELLTK